MTELWSFGFLLPHLHLRNSVEFGPVAMVPSGDQRLVALANDTPGVRQLVENLTDQFGERIAPSALLFRSDKPASVDYYALACFRNCLALCSVIDGTIFQLSGGTAGYPVWSDYFDFYPYTVDTSGQLTARSVAILDISPPGEFKGQKAPHLPSGDRLSFGYDENIFLRCMRAWRDYFVKEADTRPNRTLFRAVEVAYQAMRVPAVGSPRPTIHDSGIGVALWVSAFEVLAHPWGKQANVCAVLDVLGKAVYLDPELRSTKYRFRYGRPPKFKFRQNNFVQRLYTQLYSARNDYLHGNTVDGSNLFPDGNQKMPNLLRIAPLIFRAVLDGHLRPIRRYQGLRPERQAAEMMHLSYQGRYERAILKCKA
jgi:hypothetical protein